MARDPRKLKVFSLVDSLVIDVYKVTRGFPKDELYGLTSQLRRAAVSVPTNIVEGCARSGEREYCHFLNIAYASLAEVGYLLNLSHRLGFLAAETYKPMRSNHQEASRMLLALHKRMKHR